MSRLIFKDADRKGGNKKDRYIEKYLKPKKDGKAKKANISKDN